MICSLKSCVSKVISLILLLIVYNNGFTQTEKCFKKIIVQLTNSLANGRATSTDGINYSKQIIIDEYKKNNAKPYDIKNNCFIQSFIINDSVKDYKGMACENIISFINNKKDSTIIFSAHYDHIGCNAKLSKEISKSKKQETHFGADDNASGVALILSLSKYLSNKISNYNYLFVNFSAHEIGLYGSDYFFKSEYFQSLKIKAIINFDMVGRLNEKTKTISVGGLNKYPVNLSKLISKKINIVSSENQLLQSDVTIFYNNNYKTYTFTTGIHDDYHKTTDTEDKINYKGMKIIHTFIIKFITHI